MIGIGGDGIEMRILVYAPSEGGSGKDLRKVMEERGFGEAETHDTMEGLCVSLRQPRGDMVFAVLLAESREELDKLLSIRHLLSDIRMILILPDRESDTIAKGHSLRPRFLTYSDANFTDIAVVLNRMSGKDEKGVIPSAGYENNTHPLEPLNSK